MCTVPEFQPKFKKILKIKYICLSNEYFFCKFLLQYELLGLGPPAPVCYWILSIKSANFEITHAVLCKKYYLNYNIIQQKCNVKHKPIG